MTENALLPITICGSFALDFIQARMNGEYIGPTLAGDAITSAYWIRDTLGDGAPLTLISEIPTDRPGNQLAKILEDSSIITYPELRPNRTSRVAYWDKTRDGQDLNQDKSQLLETQDSRLSLLPQIDLPNGDGIFCLMSSAITRDWQLGWNELALQARDKGKTIVTSPNTRAIKDPEKREVYLNNLFEELALSDYVVISRKDLGCALPDHSAEEALGKLMMSCEADFIVTDRTNPTAYYTNESLKMMGLLTPLFSLPVNDTISGEGLDTVGAGGAFVAGFTAKLAGAHIGPTTMPTRGDTSLRETQIEVNDLIIQQYGQLITAGHVISANHVHSKNNLGFSPWGNCFNL